MPFEERLFSKGLRNEITPLLSPKEWDDIQINLRFIHSFFCNKAEGGKYGAKHVKSKAVAHGIMVLPAAADWIFICIVIL